MLSQWTRRPGRKCLTTEEENRRDERKEDTAGSDWQTQAPVAGREARALAPESLVIGKRTRNKAMQGTGQSVGSGQGR